MFIFRLQEGIVIAQLVEITVNKAECQSNTRACNINILKSENSEICMYPVYPYITIIIIIIISLSGTEKKYPSSFLFTRLKT